MSLVVTYAAGSSIETGSAAFTGLDGSSGVQIFPGANPNSVNPSTPVPAPFTCKERHDMRLFVFVTANQAFHLNYEYTPDGGTTWLIGDQVASATVTVDDTEAGMVNAAVLEIHVGYRFRVTAYNTSGSAANGAFEYRYAT